MKLRSLFIVAFTALSLVSCGKKQSAVPAYEKGLGNITVEKSELYVGTLADDRLEGRKTGTPALDSAATYIVGWLEEMGIRPYGESYFQVFDTARIRELTGTRRANLTPVRNVIGKIEGTNPNEYVVIGAHYDHMGVNDKLEGDQIFNGADDNASGVGGVLQIAGAFAASGEKPERTVIFAFWDAEEIGLLGSNCFVRSFPDSTANIKGCLNFDMIGRDEMGSGMQVAYYTTDNVDHVNNVNGDIAAYDIGVNIVTDIDSLIKIYPGFLRVLNGDTTNIEATLNPSSDHAPFQNAGVPVYRFGTGKHVDYHKVSDHIEKINFQKMTYVSKLGYLTMYRVANPGKEVVYPVADKTTTE